MNYNTDIIRTYIEYLDLICQAFDTKPIQKKPFYTKLNMERHSFERKVKAKSFTPTEVLQLAELMNMSFHESVS